MEIGERVSIPTPEHDTENWATYEYGYVAKLDGRRVTIDLQRGGTTTVDRGVVRTFSEWMEEMFAEHLPDEA